LWRATGCPQRRGQQLAAATNAWLFAFAWAPGTLESTTLPEVPAVTRTVADELLERLRA
jgi:hypothetical protein